MIHELDAVALNVNLPAHSLKKGDVGTVVVLHKDGEMEMEFVNFGGDTVALAHLRSEQVRRIGKKEVLQARLVGAGKPAGRNTPSVGRQPVKKLRAG